MDDLAAADSCVFCAIVAGRADSSLVHSGEHVVAFMDVRPLTPGHLLVVPRAHAGSLETLGENLGALVFLLAICLLAFGEAAGQEVFHVHLHVLPRTAGDGFGIRAQRGTPSRLELDAEASQIRVAGAALA